MLAPVNVSRQTDWKRAISDMRVKLATGLMLIVLSLLGSASATAETGPSVKLRYACAPAQNLVVTKSGSSASVQFIDRTYELRRKPSSIGEKYTSNTAALIIDGTSAVFVADDRIQLGACVEAARLAKR